MKIPMIHPETIAGVKDRADILDIIGAHVILKKRGKEYVGLCPFHQEKSPSFSVAPDKGMFYCFGCQAGGDPISFLSKISGKGFQDTILDLANQYQVEVKSLDPELSKQIKLRLARQERIYECLAMAEVYFQHTLNSGNQLAEDYLYLDRKLDTLAIQSWGLGLAPTGWKTLHDYLTIDKKVAIDIVIAAGLVIANKDKTGYYDRFRDRLMIPIRNRDGRCIGFGARTLTSEMPKYINSPETELFIKGDNLFGIDRAREQITKRDRVVVVEGYFDAMALHSAGITNAVAALGTSLSVNQIKQLVKLTESKQIVLNFDSDGAGQIATDRAIDAVSDLVYQGQLQLRILNLPSGKDADEYLSSHTEADYRALLDRAPLWLDWQLSQIINDCDFTRGDRYVYATGRIIELLVQISDLTTRIYYTQTAAVLLSNGNSSVISQLNTSLTAKIQSQLGDRHNKPQITLPPQSLIKRTESLVLRFYLNYPELRLSIIDRVDSAPLTFTHPPYGVLWSEIANNLAAYDDPDLAKSLYHLADLDPDLRLLFYDDQDLNTDPSLLSELISSALDTLYRISLESQIQDLVTRIRNDDPDRNQLHQILMALKSQLSTI